MTRRISSPTRSPSSPTGATAAATAVMAQEMSAVQALKRLSIGALPTLDPDLPNYNEASSSSSSSIRVSPTPSPRSEFPGFDFSSPSLSSSSNHSNLQVPSDKDVYQPEFNASQASQLLWVPAHVHPEIAPQQWKSFVQDKLAEIRATQSADSSNPSASRSSSISSNSNSIKRRNSRLSRQIKDQEGYTDGADVLEKRRSTDNLSQKPNDPTIQSLSHQLESLGELEGWSVDPFELVRSLSMQQQNKSNPSQSSSSQQYTHNPLANDSDAPILPTPTSSLRRSTRTRINKSSIRRGRRDVADSRPQTPEHSALQRSSSIDDPESPQSASSPYNQQPSTAALPTPIDSESHISSPPTAATPIQPPRTRTRHSPERKPVQRVRIPITNKPLTDSPDLHPSNVPATNSPPRAMEPVKIRESPPRSTESPRVGDPLRNRDLTPRELASNLHKKDIVGNDYDNVPKLLGQPAQHHSKPKRPTMKRQPGSLSSSSQIKQGPQDRPENPEFLERQELLSGEQAGPSSSVRKSTHAHKRSSIDKHEKSRHVHQSKPHRRTPLPESESRPVLSTASGPELKLEKKAESKSESKAEVYTESKAHRKAVPKAQSKTEPTDLRREPSFEPKAASLVEPKTDSNYKPAIDFKPTSNADLREPTKEAVTPKPASARVNDFNPYSIPLSNAPRRVSGENRTSIEEVAPQPSQTRTKTRKGTWGWLFNGATGSSPGSNGPSKPSMTPDKPVSMPLSPTVSTTPSTTTPTIVPAVSIAPSLSFASASNPLSAVTTPVSVITPAPATSFSSSSTPVQADPSPPFSSEGADKAAVDKFLNRAPVTSSPNVLPTIVLQATQPPEVVVTTVEEEVSSRKASGSHYSTTSSIAETKDRISNFFSKKKSVANLKQQKYPESSSHNLEKKSSENERLRPETERNSRSPSPNTEIISNAKLSKSSSKGRSQAKERSKTRGRYRSRSRNKSQERMEHEPAQQNDTEQQQLQNSAQLPNGMPGPIKNAAGLVAYNAEAAAYYGAPYQIPAHQYSDKSLYMMNHRYAPHIERAIYRLSHLKLGNPRRPLVQQVLLSNFMYAYLNLINQGFIRQQQEAQMQMQIQQSQEKQDGEPLYEQQSQQPMYQESGYNGQQPVDQHYDGQQQYEQYATYNQEYEQEYESQYDQYDSQYAYNKGSGSGGFEYENPYNKAPGAADSSSSSSASSVAGDDLWNGEVVQKSQDDEDMFYDSQERVSR